ncbi:MAG: sugar nucleotide-binding protein [Thermacetogeniaceae bacterium]
MGQGSAGAEGGHRPGFLAHLYPRPGTGTLKLLETGLYGRYHLCNSGSCSRYGWAEFILKQINWSGKLLPAKSADFDTPAARPQYSVLDSLPYTQLVGEELPGWQEATADFLARIRGA